MRQAIGLGEVGDTRELPVLEDAVGDAQAHHVAVLVGGDVEQPVVAPAEIVGGLGELVLGRLLDEAGIGVEGMFVALPLLRVGQLAALGDRERSAPGCGWRRVPLGAAGPGAAAPPVARPRPGARRSLTRTAWMPGDEAFQIALLVGRKICTHVDVLNGMPDRLRPRGGRIGIRLKMMAGVHLWVRRLSGEPDAVGWNRYKMRASAVGRGGASAGLEQDRQSSIGSTSNKTSAGPATPAPRCPHPAASGHPIGQPVIAYSRREPEAPGLESAPRGAPASASSAPGGSTSTM